ncbi:MAG: hypothetical protein HYV32_03555 [Candidatus Kerfeldbacteria bacterium]|nr:hypothetical protein [Candidatus Kerfeldbacteria bacterium]
MKILIMDDNPLHRAAAQAQLNDHELTVVSTYDDAQALIGKKHDFDVVLVDLLMPPSKKNLNSQGKRFTRKEMPVGIFLALLAARFGAKYVAVVTDAGHHDHPASTCFDAFNPFDRHNVHNPNAPQPFKLNDAKVILCNNCIDYFYGDDLSRQMAYGQYNTEKGKVIAVKNWRLVLEALLQS